MAGTVGQVRGDLKLALALALAAHTACFVVRIRRRVMVIIDDAIEDERRRHDGYLLINHLAIELPRNNVNLHKGKLLPPSQATQKTSTCPAPIPYLMYLRTHDLSLIEYASA